MATTGQAETEEKAVRVGSLSTVDNILKEAGRVYRAARRGNIEPENMTRFINALHKIYGILEGSVIARDVEEIKLGQQKLNEKMKRRR